MSDAWILTRSTIASSILNLDSSRSRNQSLEKRREGWTEVWGRDNDAGEGSKKEDAWIHEEEVISRALSTTHPPCPLTLFQFRPAWFEQVLLRFAGVPHTVVNSRFAATEATGPLPYLLEDTTRSSACHLVGRDHPSSSTNKSASNCILEHLQKEGYVNLDASLSPSQRSLSHALTTLVTSQLEPALLSLRYGDDDAWNQVYRTQYVQAGGRFQAWCIRVVGKRQLHKVWTVQESCQIARQAYQALETQLEQQSNKHYLLGTDCPTTVDAHVWAHLADALCDVHLVTILADFPLLVTYFQRIFDTYFRISDQDDEWKVWNNQQNTQSPFSKLPVEDSNTPTIHDALELMQSVSVHTHDLQEVLLVSKKQRASNPVPTRQRHTMLYRWRMGDGIRPPAAEEEETFQQKQWRKTHKRNDELWLSAVVAVTALAVFFGSVRSAER